MLTPNTTEWDWYPEVAALKFETSTLALGLIDPEFTDDEQMLPLTSMSKSQWIVYNPTILLNSTNEENLSLTKDLNGTVISIGYNGIGMPYSSYYSFFNWLLSTVLINDLDNWQCSGALGGYCYSKLTCENYAADSQFASLSKLMFTLNFPEITASNG